jgi:prevent-host-death family protein
VNPLKKWTDHANLRYLAIFGIMSLELSIGAAAMITELLSLDDLPRQNASQVKNKWGDVVRQVHQMGSVAITSHSAVEMVLLDAATYQQLTEDLGAIKEREQSILDDLAGRFNTRLAVLQEPDAQQKVMALFDSRGKLARRPKAGASF